MSNGIKTSSSHNIKLEDVLEQIKPSVTIAWGERNLQNDNPIRTFRFNTEKELDAFLQGVNECDGWWDYATIGEGYMFETEEEWRKSNE